tara:strand:- start:584 stop:2056 length:1473 start_codon:yes stop_codon:yes gene_type:complete
VSAVAEAIGFNLIVISPTITLVITALILLFFTITIKTNETVKQVITICGILFTIFCVFLKFGLFLQNGISSYFTQKILLDEFSLFGNVLISLILLFNFIPIWESSSLLKEKTTEAIILILMSAAGFMLMIDSENLIMLFIGLEIGSISLYALAGLNRGDKLSNEASLKYFLLGSLASCILIYGVSLVYVSFAVQSVYNFALALSYVGPDVVPLTTSIGMILIFVGLLFKIAAAPFQSWAPDVYQGSPTGYVGYMASIAKVSSFIVIARLCQVSLRLMPNEFDSFFLIVVILSTIIGSVFATVQQDLKRLLAYSGVVQSGFILSGIVSGVNGTSASMFYLFTYIIQLTGIFAIFSIVNGRLSSDFLIEGIQGLIINNRFLATTFCIFMLGLAGIPLTSGFVSKFILLTNLWAYEKYLLVTILLLSTVAGFYFYLRPIWIATIEKTETPVETLKLKKTEYLLISSLAALTIFFGLVPSSLINISRWVVQSYL